MQKKLLIAGAVVAVISICAIAVAVLTLSQGPGQASTSAQPTAPALTPTPVPAPEIGLGSVTGSVIDTYGQPLPGLLVTLHLMAQNGTVDAWELYNMTTTTYQDEPFKGGFVFDNVELWPEVSFAYVTTQVQYNGSVYSGRTDNFALQANAAAKDKDIVLHLPPGYLNSTSAQTSASIRPTPCPIPLASCTVSGQVLSSRGHPLPGVNVSLHIAAGSRELYNQSGVTEKQPSVGTYSFSGVPVPTEAAYAYVTASVRDAKNDAIYYGRTDNATLSEGTIDNLSIVMHLPAELESSVLNST